MHASLSAIGRVDGGGRGVVAALLEAIGDGNLVVAAGTDQNSLTSRAHLARIAGLTDAEAASFRQRMPAFDPRTTPSTSGAISEAVRTTPGAVRSAHPQSSFAALGPQAAELMADHPLECHLGRDSPLGKLYKRDTAILLVGVGYRACSALHLAEYLYVARPPMRTYWCVIFAGGRRSWRAYRDVVLDDRQFDAIR